MRGAKNLPTSQWLAPEGVNVYDILRHEYLIVTKAAAKQIEAALIMPDDKKDEANA